MTNYISLSVFFTLLVIFLFLVKKRNKQNEFHIYYIIVNVILLLFITSLYILIQFLNYNKNYFFNMINLLHITSFIIFLLHVKSVLKGYRVKFNGIYAIPIVAYLTISVFNYFGLYLTNFQTDKVNFLLLKIEDGLFFSDKILTKGFLMVVLILMILYDVRKNIGSSFTIKKKSLYKVWIYSYCFLLIETILVSNTYYFGLFDASYDTSINALIRFNAIFTLLFFYINPYILFYLPLINQVSVYSHVEKENYFDLIHSMIENEELYLIPRLSINKVALNSGISVKNIRASILVNRNQNFNDYINFLRVKKAEDLIRMNYLDRQTIEALGAKSGFNSRKSFYRAFKKTHKTTPSLYAKKIKKMQADHKRRKG